MEFDPIETCPYDNVHRVRRSRMQFHITTCSKNFPVTKLMQCPFDARHKVNQVEFEYHKNHCQARESVIEYALYDVETQSDQRIVPIDVNPVGISDENWDEGANVKTYNPIQAIQDKPIVYSIIGESKAKRKNHRLQERMRFNEIMAKSGQTSLNQTDLQSNSSFKEPQQPPKKSVNEEEEEYKPLRRPLGPSKKINAASQNKNQTVIPSEDLKKSSPKVNKTSNVPLNYATALSKKETNPILNNSKDSVIDMLSRTLEEIGVDDEGYKKKTEQLDKELNMLKKNPSEKKKQGNKNNNFVQS